MPAKRKLPRNARRLPKGTTVDDYEPEVIAEWIRDRNRQYKETHRRRQRHNGIRDVTFPLGKECRAALARLCKAYGKTKTQLIESLIQREYHDYQEHSAHPASTGQHGTQTSHCQSGTATELAQPGHRKA